MINNMIPTTAIAGNDQGRRGGRRSGEGDDRYEQSTEHVVAIPVQQVRYHQPVHDRQGGLRRWYRHLHLQGVPSPTPHRGQLEEGLLYIFLAAAQFSMPKFSVKLKLFTRSAHEYVFLGIFVLFNSLPISSFSSFAVANDAADGFSRIWRQYRGLHEG